MADALRGSMDAAEYKHVALGLIFLKYISDAFEGLGHHLATLTGVQGGNLLILLMTPSSQGMEPPGNSGRFSRAWMHDVAIPEVLRTRMYARICRGRLVPRSAT